MKCEICNNGPQQGVTVFRVNEKGVMGRWRCREHITNEQANKVHPEVIEIANIIDPPATQRPTPQPEVAR
jgi:hypothetical protein